MKFYTIISLASMTLLWAISAEGAKPRWKESIQRLQAVGLELQGQRGSTKARNHQHFIAPSPRTGFARKDGLCRLSLAVKQLHGLAPRGPLAFHSDIPTLRVPGEKSRKLLPEQVVPYIEEASLRYGINPSLIKAVIQVESGFDAKALSPKGCIGLMQLHPNTAKEIGVDPWNVRQNILGGTYYLRKMYDHFGTIKKALWAYNAGPERVKKNISPRETKVYIKRVLSAWRSLDRSKSLNFSRFLQPSSYP